MNQSSPANLCHAYVVADGAARVVDYSLGPPVVGISLQAEDD